MLTAGFGYIPPGPLTTGDTVGTGGVAAPAMCAVRKSRQRLPVMAAIFMRGIMAQASAPGPGPYPRSLILQVAEPPVAPSRLHAGEPPTVRVQQGDDTRPHGVHPGQPEAITPWIEE